MSDSLCAPAAGIPWVARRAGFILMMLRAMSKLPVVLVPAGIRFQPVETDEAAARLAELTLGSPAGQVPDIAGPKVYPVVDLLRS